MGQFDEAVRERLVPSPFRSLQVKERIIVTVNQMIFAVKETRLLVHGMHDCKYINLLILLFSDKLLLIYLALHLILNGINN